ncbi:hypothetical protein RJJ63_30215, partial [Rhizobium hidalgonense]|uniref:hypothetical protein n=1 Tax=Rhizobium hidalgonense TaxID=1538159 RepID=UPI0028722B57
SASSFVRPLMGRTLIHPGGNSQWQVTVQRFRVTYNIALPRMSEIGVPRSVMQLYFRTLGNRDDKCEVFVIAVSIVLLTLVSQRLARVGQRYPRQEASH